MHKKKIYIFRGFIRNKAIRTAITFIEDTGKQNLANDFDLWFTFQTILFVPIVYFICVIHLMKSVSWYTWVKLFIPI